jgi:TonB family protein
MRGLLLLALAFLTPVTALANLPPLVGDPKAPVKLVSFAAPPSSIACAGTSARLIEAAALPPKVWQVWTPPVPPVGVAAYVPPPPPSTEVYSFSVDADGHVTDLKRASGLGGTIPWAIDEPAAIIASWRFAPGAPAKDCTIDLAPRYSPIAEASPARLFEALADDPRAPNPPLRKALAAGSDCDGPTRRRPQTIVYPDLRPFDDKTVDPAWAGLRFDIDAAGAARNVRVVAQHGEPAFADAVASAVAEARYFPGPPRAGCHVAFKAMPKATPPPQHAPPPADDDACKITQAELNLPETKFFPPTFGKRRVGGRAVLRFDVAPWGQIGAIEVLEAQPAAAFGDAARMLLMSARPKAPPTGYRGCVVPIVYAIPAIPEDEY